MEVIAIPDATQEPEAYVEALLELVGKRDPIEIFSSTWERLVQLTSDLADEVADRQPAENEWSARQLLGHLFDAELVHGFRWRLILTEESPTYPGYDDKFWAQLPKPPIPQLLQAWKGLRDANIVLLKSVPASAWDRIGVHGEQGLETLDRSVRKLAAHDLAHLNQLERTLVAMTKG
jgi:hypothetical protein